MSCLTLENVQAQVQRSHNAVSKQPCQVHLICRPSYTSFLNGQEHSLSKCFCAQNYEVGALRALVEFNREDLGLWLCDCDNTARRKPGTRNQGKLAGKANIRLAQAGVARSLQLIRFSELFATNLSEKLGTRPCALHEGKGSLTISARLHSSSAHASGFPICSHFSLWRAHRVTEDLQVELDAVLLTLPAQGRHLTAPNVHSNLTLEVCCPAQIMATGLKIT